MFRRLICNLFYYCVVDLQYRHHNHHHHHHFIIYDTSSMLAFPRVTSTCSNLIYTRHILRRHNTQQPTSILRNHITGHIHTPRIYRVARSRRIRLSRVGVTSFRHCARPLDCLRLWIGLAIIGGLRFLGWKSDGSFRCHSITGDFFAKAEAQVSQRRCAMIHVIEYFAETLEVIRNDTLEYKRV